MGTSSFFFTIYHTVIIITYRPLIPSLRIRLSLHFSRDNNSRIYCFSSSALFKNLSISFFKKIFPPKILTFTACLYSLWSTYVTLRWPTWLELGNDDFNLESATNRWKEKASYLNSLCCNFSSNKVRRKTAVSQGGCEITYSECKSISVIKLNLSLHAHPQ